MHVITKMHFLNFFHIHNRRYIFTSIPYPRKLTKLALILTIALTLLHYLTKVHPLKRQEHIANTNEETSQGFNNKDYATLQSGQNQHELNAFSKETNTKGTTEISSSDNFITLPVNLISMEIIDNSQVALQHGWWILQPESWSLQDHCDTDTDCHKSVDLNATPGVMYTVFQFITLRQYVPIRGVYFSVTSSTDAQIWDERAINYYGASAMIRFDDASSQVINLSFQPINTELIQSNVSYMFPIGGAAVTSITVMLGVKGLVGKVTFRDIELKPIMETHQENHHWTKFHFITTCPDVLSPPINTPNFSTKHFVLNDNGIEKMRPITMVTQLSFDRWKTWATRILPQWNGPVSVALYIPTGKESSDTKPEDIAKTLENFNHHCDITVVYGASEQEKYPINYLRNLAMELVRTEYMLLVDADFYVSPNFIESFLSSIPQQSSLTNAYVVPAFEYRHGPSIEPLAKSKMELVTTLLQPGARIQPFRYLESEMSHKPTDYQKWYTTSTIYPIKDYQIAYEPYLVLKTSVKNKVRYDERFAGYGMNKISFIMELIAAGYNFKVLPYCWVTHLPHKPSGHSFTFLTNFSENLNNRVMRFEFISDLTKRYKLGACKVP